MSVALVPALAIADVVRHISRPEPGGLHAPITVGVVAMTIVGLHLADAAG